MTKHTPNLKAQKIAGGVHADQRHDSAHKHVAGTAVYIDDIPEPAGTLHVGLGLAAVAHGTIRSVDLSAVKAAPGVVGVLTHEDVPGENDISPSGMHDDPILAEGILAANSSASSTRYTERGATASSRRASRPTTTAAITNVTTAAATTNTHVIGSTRATLGLRRLLRAVRCASVAQMRRLLRAVRCASVAQMPMRWASSSRW